MGPQLLMLYGDRPDFPCVNMNTTEYLGDWRHALAKAVKIGLAHVPFVGPTVSNLIPERMLTIPKRAVTLPSNPSAAQKAITGAIVQSALDTAQPILSKLAPKQKAAAEKSIASQAANVAQNEFGGNKMLLVGGAALGLVALIALTKKRSA